MIERRNESGEENKKHATKFLKSNQRDAMGMLRVHATGRLFFISNVARNRLHLEYAAC
jgi:hypothetical protein